jgi:curli biogenesis system outer membrane secretion channel CsgG
MFKKMGAMALMLALTSGCATTINMANYGELECDKRDCEIAPPEYIINKKKPKVAILPVADVTDFAGKLSKPAQETLTQLMTSGTGLEVVERSQMDKLFEEAKFKESVSGDIDPEALAQLAKDVDFVIMGSVSNIATGARFTEESSYKDKKGKIHYTAPSCTFSGEATVNVRAVSTATGSIYKVFAPFKGRVSSSTELRNSRDCRVGDSFQLASLATASAIENGRASFMDAFPNYGYVSKTLTNSKDSKDRVAQITLGRNDGVRAGDWVTLAKYVKSFDRIKKSESVSLQDLGEARINETGLGDDQSYVLLPEELAAEVAVGYIVKTKSNSRGFRF